MPRPKLAQIPTTTLKNSINSTDTTIVLTSLKAIQNVEVTFADLYGKATLAPTTSSEEIVSFTGLAFATDGTATLTGVTRNLSPIHPYTTLGAGVGHSAGTQVSFSNNPQLYEAILDYIDSVAISGAPDASVVTKGIVKLSVAPVSSANPIAVGDNDPRLPTQDEKDGIAGLSATNRPIQGDTITQSGKGGAIGEQTSSVDSRPVGEANATTKANKLAFRFVPTKTKIRGVELFKKADTGTFTGTVTIALQTDVTNNPSGTDVVSYTFTNAQWLALSNDAPFEAIFASEFDLLDLSLTYWIVITTSTSDNANYVNIGSRNAGGNSTAKYFNTTDSWVTLSNTDLYYKIMEGNVEQVVMTGPDGFINYALVKAVKTIELNLADSPYTWNKPTGLKSVLVELYGGGGGGGGGGNHTGTTALGGGGGGGGGAYASKIFFASQLNTNVSVTVGAGGQGGAGGTTGSINNGNSATSGGTSSFGTLLFAYGGGGGTSGTTQSGGGGGGGSQVATGGVGSSGNILLGTAPFLINDATLNPTRSNYGTGGAGRGILSGQVGCAEYGGAAGGSSDSFLGGSSIHAGSGGGGGGRASSGGAGGKTGTYSMGGGAAGGGIGTGTAGENGVNIGDGGGGGGTNAGVGQKAGDGGNGNIAGGGGGGGSSRNDGGGGKGGNGGNGFARITEFY